MGERKGKEERKKERENVSSLSVCSQWAGPPPTYLPLFDVMKGESV